MLIFVFWFSGIFPSKRGVRGVTPSYEVRGVTPTDAMYFLSKFSDLKYWRILLLKIRTRLKSTIATLLFKAIRMSFKNIYNFPHENLTIHICTLWKYRES